MNELIHEILICKVQKVNEIKMSNNKILRTLFTKLAGRKYAQ